MTKVRLTRDVRNQSGQILRKGDLVEALPQGSKFTLLKAATEPLHIDIVASGVRTVCACDPRKPRDEGERCPSNSVRIIGCSADDFEVVK